MSGFFGKGPIFQTQPLTLSQIFTAFLASARTFLDAVTVNGTFTVNKTAGASGSFETMADFKVTDDATGYLRFANNSSSDGILSPIIIANVQGTNTAMSLRGSSATDTGTSPIVDVTGRISSAAAATRPVFAFNNHTTRLGTWWPTGLMIGSGASTAAAAKLEVQGSEAQIAFGTAADCGFLFANSSNAFLFFGGRFNGTNYIARQTTAAHVRPYSSGISFAYDSGLTIGNSYTPTERALLNATGLGVKVTPAVALDVGGSWRVTSFSTAPTTGAGLEGRYGATADQADILAKEYVGGTYKALALMASAITLQPNGVTALTADTTAITSVKPVVFPSYTLATLPAASTVTRGQVWVSDMTGGAQFAYSDGTNWRRVSDLTVAS